jgi:hypothetical protein
VLAFVAMSAADMSFNGSGAVVISVCARRPRLVWRWFVARPALPRRVMASTTSDSTSVKCGPRLPNVGRELTPAARSARAWPDEEDISVSEHAKSRGSDA